MVAGIAGHVPRAAQGQRPADAKSIPAEVSGVVRTIPVVAADARFSDLRGREGFWRIARTHEGVWWFLSPQNKAEFLNGVTTVQPSLDSWDAKGPRYVSGDWDPAGTPAGVARWAEMTALRVRAAGFKSLGAWCNPALHDGPLPMTRDLNVCRWVPYGAMLFGAEWQRGADAAIRAQATPLRENRNLIGYYIDNELEWNTAAMGPRLFFDNLGAQDPNRREVFGVIRSIWQTVEAFNSDWHTSLTDWSELERNGRLPQAPSPTFERLETRWLAHVAEAYFRITTSLIRKYDPNHLILGCRYRGGVPAEVPQGARDYTDAQSINYYAADSLLDAQTFQAIAERSNQPVIVSEYSFHAPDGRSGNRNRSGFPGGVANQAARAAGYRLMTRRLAQVPYVIGADWFQWMDEPPAGRARDGEDANLGVVDLHDQPYQPLVEAIRETAPLLDGIHARSSAGANQMVWRTPPQGNHKATAFAGGNDLLEKQ